MSMTMVQGILKKSVHGALLGAGVGMGVSIAYELIHRGTNDEKSVSGGKKDDRANVKYRNILEDSELNVIVDDLTAFREVSPPAFEKLLQELDKFAAISALIQSFSSQTNRNGDEFDAGWSVTAHYHGDSVTESMLALEYSITDSMKDNFAEKKKELQQYVDNTLYNINMHTQTIMGT